ncbi:Transposable element Tc3 transposase [Caligus rogercresseyi]|uniref:Transposable element Tc3 transposase n=1 Tax=Caligus rogercresseyi TaxID=217165 RepID=A0A7T8HLS9_CALRO|nr:Transposable element Tc3 transposase [Caligus rogercresseyi]
MRWSREERAFAVEAYFSNHQSVIATQRSFALILMLHLEALFRTRSHSLHGSKRSEKPGVQHNKEFV